jgi:hypothetical protein
MCHPNDWPLFHPQPQNRLLIPHDKIIPRGLHRHSRLQQRFLRTPHWDYNRRNSLHLELRAHPRPLASRPSPLRIHPLRMEDNKGTHDPFARLQRPHCCKCFLQRFHPRRRAVVFRLLPHNLCTRPLPPTSPSPSHAYQRPAH